VNPDLEVLRVSALTGDGIDDWLAFLRSTAARVSTS
jgi:hypothetical protein